MIQQNELRYGNYIGYNGGFFMVRQICHVDIQGVWSKDGNVSSENDTYDSFEPIPLTSELLERCGFVEKGFVNQDQDDVEWMEHSKFDYLKYRDGECYLNGPISLPYIEYLHQLQNLYFALTGTELEVDLIKLETN